jgi:hypothetical protein
MCRIGDADPLAGVRGAGAFLTAVIRPMKRGMSALCSNAQTRVSDRRILRYVRIEDLADRLRPCVVA